VLPSELRVAVSRLIAHRKEEQNKLLEAELQQITNEKLTQLQQRIKECEQLNADLQQKQQSQYAANQAIIIENARIDRGVNTCQSLLSAVQSNSIRTHYDKQLRGVTVLTMREVSKLSRVDQIAYHVSALERIHRAAQDSFTKQKELSESLNEVRMELERSLS
jgi:predicted phosphoribosyltransferase